MSYFLIRPWLYTRSGILISNRSCKTEFVFFQRNKSVICVCITQLERHLLCRCEVHSAMDANPLKWFKFQMRILWKKVIWITNRNTLSKKWFMIKIISHIFWVKNYFSVEYIFGSIFLLEIQLATSFWAYSSCSLIFKLFFCQSFCSRFNLTCSSCFACPKTLITPFKFSKSQIFPDKRYVLFHAFLQEWTWSSIILCFWW